MKDKESRVQSAERRVQSAECRLDQKNKSKINPFLLAFPKVISYLYFMKNEKILIGGKALVTLGSSRLTLDTDYLINDETSKDAFLHDKENNIDYLNANGNKFFKEIFTMEKGNQIASPQALLELKAYAFVQHCQNFAFQKADDAEYDMKFLCRKYDLKEVRIVNNYISNGELSEVQKVIQSVKK